jgi:hypothetical protein
VLSPALLSAAAALLFPLFLRAQSAGVWSDGPWTVLAPAAGNCGSLPLLPVKGPGSIFDPPNASFLAALEKALPGALAKACPGAREVILVSGRNRRLIKLSESSAAAPAASPPPLRETLPEQTAPVVAGRRAATPAPPPQPQPSTATSSPAQVLAPRSELRSLSSARKIEDKCEVLLSWLENGKSESAPSANYRRRLSAGMLPIFRDEPMMAVFGSPYDKTENRWRLEQHEKVISRCLGLSTPRNNPFGARQANRTLQQYGQQFQQYGQILAESFLGQSGSHEPAAISRYVQQIRAQLAWANQAMASAAAAQPVRESFDRLTAQRQAVPGQLSLLSAREQSQVADYLAHRQSEIAPVITEDWFREAGGSQKTAASAKVLHNSHAGIAHIARALNAPAKAAWDGKYNRLIDSLVVDSVQAEVAKLNTIPASLPGVLQLASWKERFDAAFRELRSVPSVEAAGYEYTQARARVFTGALPSWLGQVENLPLEAASVAAKHRELESLFPAKEDRSSPVFVQYQTPLRAKEDQLRIRIAAESRKQQEANAAVQRPPAPSDAFSASGLSNEKVLTSLYRGDFVNIDFDRDELKFAGFFEQYLKAYGSRCAAYLPANKVEMTYQECAVERRTTNGFGVTTNTTCVEYRTVRTGLYADPVLYDTKKKLERLQAADVFRNAFGMMTQKDPVGGMVGMVNTLQAIAGDMNALVQMNACAGAGLKRFEENLTRFALNKQPVRLDGETSASAVTVSIPGIPFRDQNYTKLVEDLVLEHSKTWKMNRFVDGSVTDASVSSRDKGGRPAKIVARYTYNGFNGRSQGSVTVDFSEGLPECMYFFDFPSTCRTPNRKVVAAYANAGYEQ